MIRRAGLLPLAVFACGRSHAQHWTHFAADVSRASLAADGPAAPASASWITGAAGSGSPITFVGLSSPVVYGGRVFAIGFHSGVDQGVCMDGADGRVLWSAPINTPSLNSWGSPACDSGNDAVIFATGNTVRAFHAVDGRPLWRCTLQGSFVNASPLVTTDRHPTDRVFISTFSNSGAGLLCCINADPYDAARNPHQPGDLLWSVSLGWSSGNTPAYADGTVIVGSTSDETGSPPGRVFAFPADATSAPPPRWVFTNVKPAGFFGGVSVRGGAVFAASYAFSGGRDSANLVKLDAATGGLRWSINANRTSATPVPLSDGRVLLSGGIDGFGSAPALQMFRDRGSNASLEWDTAADTWNDLNSNNRLDPGEYFRVGAWNVQPAVCEARALIYAGSPPVTGTPYAPCDNLYAIDLSRHPTHPRFVVERFAGAGSAPAIAGAALFTLGAAGMHAFNTCPADCDGSTGRGVLDIFDFLCFQNLYAAANPGADCDPGTGPRTLDIFDFLCFQNHFAQGCP